MNKISGSGKKGNLWLGPFLAEDEQVMKKNKITHVLSILNDMNKFKNLTQKIIEASDISN